MFKKALLFTLFLLNGFFSFKVLAQQPLSSPQQLKLPWQRLLLQLSTTYFTVVKENQVNLDSSLLYTSSSLGLSRRIIIAEGIDDEKLLAQSLWVDKREPAKGVLQLTNLKGIQRLELLVLLGTYYAFEPDNYHRYKDSVLYFLNKAIDESKQKSESKIERLALCVLGKMYVAGNDLTQGAAIFDKLIKQCEDAKDLSCEARAFAWRGLYTAYSPATTQDRINYLTKAIDLYRKQGNNEQIANLLTDIGYLHVSSFQLNDASQVLRQALNLEDSIGFPAKHYNYDILALITYWEGKFGEPLKYALEEIKISETIRDSIGWGYFYSRLSLLYKMQEDKQEEAMKWTLKALDHFSMGEGDPAVYLTIANMTDFAFENVPLTLKILEKIQQIEKKTPPVFPRDHVSYHQALALCYLKLKQYDLAERNLIEADRFERQFEILRGRGTRASITNQFGLLYYYKHEYRKALTFFERFLADPSHVSGGLLIELSALRACVKIDSILGNTAAQIRHLKQYSTLLDSNFRVSAVRQAEELKVKYETDEKDNQITVLNQKAKLEQARLEQEKFFRNFTIGGVLLLLIIAGLLFRQNRLKQKNNQIITQKNELLNHLVTEKEWLLKEVHHRVKNNLHTIICLLESQAMYLEKDALQAIEKSQHRIYAMSLIHQKLYQNEDLQVIEMSIYLEEFIGYLKDSFDAQKIDFIIQVDPVHLNLQQAIPVALIINEGVTNSIKYAFGIENEPKIWISMTETDEIVKLTIIDNGQGFELKAEDEGKSLGMQLIKGLSKELKGTVKIDTKGGTKLSVAFKKGALTDQIAYVKSKSIEQ